MPALNPYRIFPLGDSAITLDFGNVIDEKINEQVIAIFHSLQKEPLPGMIDAVPAYSSLTIYYDVFQLRERALVKKTVGEWMSGELEKRLQSFVPGNDPFSRSFRIPVCYEKEFALDIEEIAAIKNLSIGQLIHIHTSISYKVYMLGFLPGFAYMGEVDKQIEMPRRIQPRQRVEPGSVGIAGRQTGIYPLASPGGWQIIGRTPVKLFEASPILVAGPRTGIPGVGALEDSICLLHPGDSVQFYSISKDEFESY
jgi:inhibitor of KinA